MRTLPEIVYDLKELIQELEQHTGIYSPNPNVDFQDGMTIDIFGAGAQPTISLDIDPSSDGQFDYEFSLGNTGPSSR